MAPVRSLSILCGAALLTAAGIGAAAAQDRCEGTLCDLYYEHVAQPPAASQPAQPARGTPAPAQPAQSGDGLLGRLFGGGAPPPPADGAAPPAKKPLVAVQGGGVIGLLQGQTPQRCTGTLCDLYYGGPPPEAPHAAAEPVAAEPAATTPAPVARAQAEADEPAAAASRGIEPRESVRSCAARSGDPWACYR